MNRTQRAASGDPKDQGRKAQAPELSSSPEQTTESSDRLVLSPDRSAPLDATPGSESSQSESEELTKKLLAAYQGTLDMAEELPTVVWVRWGRDGFWRCLKLPYLRWFLRYYLIHHVRTRLQTLNRRLYAIAALADDPDANKANRETVDLYLQSLPLLPYKRPRQ